MITDIRLKSLKMENFRGFEQAETDFDEALTVFIASNGGGKTSVLDAAAEALQQWVQQLALLDGQALPTSLNHLDISNGQAAGRIELVLALSFNWYHEEEEEDGQRETVEESEQVDFRIQLTFNREDEPVVQSVSVAPEQALARLNEAALPLMGEGESLPVLFYYHGGAFDDYSTPELPPRNQRTPISNRLRARAKRLYQDGLTPGLPGYRNFYRWFDERSAYELYRQSKGQAEAGDPLLEHVRQAVDQLLSDEQAAYRNLELSYKEPGYLSPITVEKVLKSGESDELEIAQLSSGERHLFGLVSRLALRLIIANPESADPLREGFGIVLIDELDAHLHPSWQRTVIGRLQDIFPRVQFVVSTHSTFLLSNVPSKMARVIWEFSIHKVERLFPDFSNYGATLEKIARLLFRVEEPWPDEMSELFDRYFKAINANEFEEAEKLEAQLKRLTDKHHPKLLEGKAQIEFKKLSDSLKV